MRRQYLYPLRFSFSTFQATSPHYSTALMSTRRLSALIPKLTGFHTRLVLGNLATWAHGATILYPSPVFHPEAIVEAVVAERCTALHGVPTHFHGVIAELDKREAAEGKLDTRSLRCVLHVGGGPG